MATMITWRLELNRVPPCHELQITEPHRHHTLNVNLQILPSNTTANVFLLTPVNSSAYFKHPFSSPTLVISTRYAHILSHLGVTSSIDRCLSAHPEDLESICSFLRIFPPRICSRTRSPNYENQRMLSLLSLASTPNMAFLQ